MSLDIENSIILDLVQASLCYISDYFYAITVEVSEDNSRVCLYFIISEDNEEIQEAIDDIICEFEAIQTDNKIIDVLNHEVVIGGYEELIKHNFRRFYVKKTDDC